MHDKSTLKQPFSNRAARAWSDSDGGPLTCIPDENATAVPGDVAVSYADGHSASAPHVERTIERGLPDTTPVVYVVDDDNSVCTALRRLLQSMGLVVETFNSASAFLADWDPSLPGCLVLDIRMPLASGLDLQEDLIRRKAMLPIVFITGHGDVPLAVRAMKNGAVDFLAKPFDDQQLLDAINGAVKRDREIRRQQSAYADARTRISELSMRQREVLNLLIFGLTNKEIAAQLGISEKTVKVHRQQVMEKTGTMSLAELVVLSSRAGLC